MAVLIIHLERNKKITLSKNPYITIYIKKINTNLYLLKLVGFMLIENNCSQYFVFVVLLHNSQLIHSSLEKLH